MKILVPLLASVLLLAPGLVRADDADPLASPDASASGSVPMADAALDAFNQAFLVHADNLTFYRERLTSPKTQKGKEYFWKQALEIQMMEDAWVRDPKPEYKATIDALLKAFVAQNKGNGDGPDWAWNDFQDDLLWATLAFVRGAEITGNNAYLKLAKTHFDLAYTRGWDDILGGGLWWDAKFEGKFGLSNNPAVIAACHLYLDLGDPAYLDKAKAIYAWHRANLYDPNTGAVYEKTNWIRPYLPKKNPNDPKEERQHDPAQNVKKGFRPSNLKPEDFQLLKETTAYNLGAFLSGATLLYSLTGEQMYYDDAVRSIDYAKTRLTHEGGIFSDGRHDGSWVAEFARGIGDFLRENPALGDKYYPWLLDNAKASWSMRNDLNLTWNNWKKQTPNAKDFDLQALECESSVVIWQILPAAIQPPFTKVAPTETPAP